MRIKELKENESLEVIEVSSHTKVPDSPGKKSVEPQIVESTEIKMIIYTDGVLENESKEIIKNINGYNICNRHYYVDTLKIKDIKIKNYSYVIVYLIANEFANVGIIGGLFPIIKDVSVYLKNKKDKKALREAKKVIKQNQNNNRNIYNLSLFSLLFSSIRNNEEIAFEETAENIYTLTKK